MKTKKENIKTEKVVKSIEGKSFLGRIFGLVINAVPSLDSERALKYLIFKNQDIEENVEK